MEADQDRDPDTLLNLTGSRNRHKKRDGSRALYKASAMTMQPDELRAMRKKAGMTLMQMAEAIGMAVDSISRMERGMPGYPIEKRTELAVRYVVENRDHTD